MECVVLEEIPFRLDIAALLRALHLQPEGPYAEAVEALAREGAVARPKALYGAAAVEARLEDAVTIEGEVFRGRVIRVNLETADRVFPFLATCGQEIEDWSGAVEGTFMRYCADMVKEFALEAAINMLRLKMEQANPGARIATMSPGSLPDWPTDEQRNLFALFGPAAGRIGVRLTDSFIMQPVKSVSGIAFPSEDGFESCQMCQIRQCPRRRAEFDEGLYERKYRG